MWEGPEKFLSTVVYNGVVAYTTVECGYPIIGIQNEENSFLCSVVLCGYPLFGYTMKLELSLKR